MLHTSAWTPRSCFLSHGTPDQLDVCCRAAAGNAVAEPSDEETEDTDMAEAPPNPSEIVDDARTFQRLRLQSRRCGPRATSNKSYHPRGLARSQNGRPAAAASPVREAEPQEAATPASQQAAGSVQEGGDGKGGALTAGATQAASPASAPNLGLNASAWPKLPHQVRTSYSCWASAWSSYCTMWDTCNSTMCSS